MPGFPGRAPGSRAARRLMIPSAGREGTVIQLGELVMTLDLHRQGLSVSAIARRVGIDRKTVRKYIERGLDDPGPVGSTAVAGSRAYRHAARDE